MTFRSDIWVDWSVSPRIVYIQAPATEVTISDLIDTLRVLESRPQNMDDLSLLDASGSEDLGGGVSVGLTILLQNAQVAFEARLTSVSTGTATSDDVSGVFLIDTTATFQSDGVVPGATVFNETDRSAGTVLQVISDTELQLVELKDGTNNDWEIGDVYKIWNEVQCEVTGGNVVAVDTDGTSMSALFPTAFTQIVRTSSASATITELEIANTVLATLSAAAGSTTTKVRTNATQADGFYDNMLLVVVNAAGSVARTIESYTNLNGAFTVAMLPFTPAAADVVLVLAIDYTYISSIAARTALIPALI